jgi:hypothetical protein
MNAKTAKQLEKLIVATLAPHKVEAVRLEGDIDQGGDESLDVTIVLDDAVIKAVGAKGLLAITRALRSHMIDHGDERFPHVRFVSPEFFAGA